MLRTKNQNKKVYTQIFLQKLKKDLNLIFKEKIKEDYVIQKKNIIKKKKKHEICKTKVKMNFYYANMFKHEHDKIMI